VATSPTTITAKQSTLTEVQTPQAAASSAYASLVSEPSVSPLAPAVFAEEETEWGYSSFSPSLSLGIQGGDHGTRGASLKDDSYIADAPSGGKSTVEWSTVGLDDAAVTAPTPELESLSPSFVHRDSVVVAPDLEGEFSFGDHFNFDLSIGGTSSTNT
jgi:hypothetical protein